jgi:hypothetical protein
MTRQDEELRKLLRQWQAPPSGPRLDERVWSDIRGRRRVPPGRWLSIAAGVALAGALFLHLSRSRPQVVKAERQTVSVAIVADAAGFKPLANGAITVTKGTP